MEPMSTHRMPETNANDRWVDGRCQDDHPKPASCTHRTEEEGLKALMLAVAPSHSPSDLAPKTCRVSTAVLWGSVQVSFRLGLDVTRKRGKGPLRKGRTQKLSLLSAAQEPSHPTRHQGAAARIFSEVIKSQRVPAESSLSGIPLKSFSLTAK